MAFAIIHPIRREINAQYYYIKTMINAYPSFMNDWLSREEEKNKVIAKESSDGDADVFFTTYKNLCSGMDVFYETTNSFYQAVFLVTYSYYKSWLCKIGKELGCNKENIDVREIREKGNLQFENEIHEKVGYLYETVKNFRNLIAHNNNGTFKGYKKEQEEALQNICSKYDDIKENDGCVIINGSEFINDVLEMEHEILLEICDKLGYQTHYIKYNSNGNNS